MDVPDFALKYFESSMFAKRNQIEQLQNGENGSSTKEITNNVEKSYQKSMGYSGAQQSASPQHRPTYNLSSQGKHENSSTAFCTGANLGTSKSLSRNIISPHLPKNYLKTQEHSSNDENTIKVYQKIKQQQVQKFRRFLKRRPKTHCAYCPRGARGIASASQDLEF